MTYRQKTVVATLVSFGLITIYYVARVLQLAGAGQLEAQALFRLWFLVIGLSIGATIIVIIAIHIVDAVATAARTGDPDPQIDTTEDERDDLIKLKGAQVTHVAASLGVLASMLAFVLGQPGLIMFAALILSGLLAEIVGGVAQLIMYRMDL